MSSSNWRMVPIGNCGDNTTATSTVVTAPTAATIVVGSTMPRTSIARLAPIARHVGASAAPAVTRAHERLTDEHAATDERREREQQESVALDVGDVLGLADAEQLRTPLDVHRVAHDLLHLVLELDEVRFATAQRRRTC